MKPRMWSTRSSIPSSTALVDGDRVEIRGFGSFKVKDYRGYTGRNPKSGDVVNVAPKRLPFFRPGKELKELLNK